MAVNQRESLSAPVASAGAEGKPIDHTIVASNGIMAAPGCHSLKVIDAMVTS
jgi:hypothetical protein